MDVVRHKGFLIGFAFASKATGGNILKGDGKASKGIWVLYCRPAPAQSEAVIQKVSIARYIQTV